MHASNEGDFRLETGDVDRFMAMHRLLQMKHEQTINHETYLTSQRRLEGCILKDSTRQGLKNILRSTELADATAQALKIEHLRLGFNASTWGKKLVKGRFYVVITGLIMEMVEQYQLLKGRQNNLSSKPFQLAAQSCTWKQLESGVRRKNHAWQEFEGGAQAALERVKTRSPGFVHLMNPLDSDGWMLENIVLLPSVLTSDKVVNCLTDMYVIGQHMIHMVAGKDALAKYTSARADESETDHPLGIITMVLKDQLHGSTSNYPNKIIHHLWQNRSELLGDLEKQKINDAMNTTGEEYQQLILQKQSWWKLISLFKMRTLVKGLKLKVPREFNDFSKGSSADSQVSAPASTVGNDSSGPCQSPRSQANTQISSRMDGISPARGSGINPPSGDQGNTLPRTPLSGSTAITERSISDPTRSKRRLEEPAGADIDDLRYDREYEDDDLLGQSASDTDIPLAGVSTAGIA
ncbi:hypothetical protein FS749_011109 [Ceratobasidium sp. UAMH 11750]|nr:hypothetical protein FS749_011109 [Ceratobasidium sp. UAMH 11750]